MDSNPYEPPDSLTQHERPQDDKKPWPNWLPSPFWFLFMLSLISFLTVSAISVVPGTPAAIVQFATMALTAVAGLTFLPLAIYGTVRNLRSR